MIAPIEVPVGWSLVPSGLGTGERFRLMFLTRTRNATPTDIDVYNEWAQVRAAGGHDDIQRYAEVFKVLGCTEDVDARDNTGTTYTSTDKGVPIYWLNGNKADDDYEDFYDGGGGMKRRRCGLGAALKGINPERVWTGCTHSGTTYDGFALGGTQAGFGTPDNENYGPLYSLVVAGTTFSLSLYALSGVFEVVPPGEIVWSATLTVGDVTTGVVGYTGLKRIADLEDLHRGDYRVLRLSINTKKYGSRGQSNWMRQGLNR